MAALKNVGPGIPLYKCKACFPLVTVVPPFQGIHPPQSVCFVPPHVNEPYISASVQRENRLASGDTQFVVVPMLGRSGSCACMLQNTHNTTLTTMAAAGGNEPITPQIMRHQTSQQRAGQMGDNPLGKQI